MTTYECTICNGINANQHFHCQYCGTIPAHYSFLSVPIVPRKATLLDVGEAIDLYYITVHVAFGALRATRTRSAKRIARTVRLDYYASE